MSTATELAIISPIVVVVIVSLHLIFNRRVHGDSLHEFRDTSDNEKWNR